MSNILHVGASRPRQRDEKPFLESFAERHPHFAQHYKANIQCQLTVQSPREARPRPRPLETRQMQQQQHMPGEHRNLDGILPMQQPQAMPGSYRSSTSVSNTRERIHESPRDSGRHQELDHSSMPRVPDKEPSSWYNAGGPQTPASLVDQEYYPAGERGPDYDRETSRDFSRGKPLYPDHWSPASSSRRPYPTSRSSPDTSSLPHENKNTDRR